MKVLFLSVSTGGGHLKAAKALGDYIKVVDKTSEILAVDNLDYASPVVSQIVIKTYMGMLKLTPKIYRKMYNSSDSGDRFVGKGLNYFGRFVNALLSFRINKLIKKYKPDIIVCTHPFSVQMMSKIDIPTIAVLTDYSIHPLCVKECIDAYIVAHEVLVDDLMNKGVERKIIYPFGIPVEKKFLEKFERTDILEEFGLKDKMTFLIMGGSLGLGEIKDVFLRFMKSKKDFQIIIVTGKNKKLKRKLEKHLKGIHSDKDVRILGYTDKVNKLMDIADFIVTKPGGLTVAESLLKKLHICIISPIPGHEEKNANFLVNCGVAARLEENDDVDSFLNQVMYSEVRTSSMGEVAGFLAKPNACRDIYNLMCKLVFKNDLKEV